MEKDVKIEPIDISLMKDEKADDTFQIQIIKKMEELLKNQKKIS